MEFYSDHIKGGRADVAENVDEVDAECNLHAVGVFLFGAVVDTDAEVGGVAAVIGRDLFALDEDNCVGAFADAGDALQTGKFLCVQFAPEFFVLGVDEEVTHFHELACGFAKDGLEHAGGELSAPC